MARYARGFKPGFFHQCMNAIVTHIILRGELKGTLIEIYMHFFYPRFFGKKLFQAGRTESADHSIYFNRHGFRQSAAADEGNNHTYSQITLHENLHPR